MTSSKPPVDPGEDEVGRREIALTLGVSEREITNLVKANPDFPSVVRGKGRAFPRRRCVQWYVRFKSLEAVKRAKPASTAGHEERRRRREEAEMKMAEMDLAEREGRLVSIDHVDQVVGEVCERLMPIVVNMPGNYGLRLEELGVDPAKAEAILTAIADELTAALRTAADYVETGADGAADSATDESSSEPALGSEAIEAYGDAAATGSGAAAPD